MTIRKFLHRLDAVLSHSVTTMVFGVWLVVLGLLEFVESVFVMFESPFQIYQSVIAIGLVSSVRGLVEFVDGYDRLRSQNEKTDASAATDAGDAGGEVRTSGGQSAL